jgi:hypothetical protein
MNAMNQVAACGTVIDEADWVKLGADPTTLGLVLGYLAQDTTVTVRAAWR